MKISLKPIDIGFDVRVERKMPVNLPEDVTEVEIEVRPCGPTAVISGSRKEIVRKLRAKGFRIAKSGSAGPERAI
jgi:hypothetical protein